MNKRITGDTIVCPKCGKVNVIYEDGMKYPANVQEVLYCASCNEILGYKNSTGASIQGLKETSRDNDCKRRIILIQQKQSLS